MDTSSYNQGILVGGVLVLPTYDYVPLAKNVQQEEVGLLTSATPTLTIIGNVTTVAFPVRQGYI